VVVDARGARVGGRGAGARGGSEQTRQQRGNRRDREGQAPDGAWTGRAGHGRLLGSDTAIESGIGAARNR
jgi:hypothetical protein